MSQSGTGPSSANLTSATSPPTTPSGPTSGVGSLGGGGGLLTFLVASILVIGLALVVTRWLARWQYTQVKGRRMRVLEGLAIGRDRQLLLVQVGDEVLLLGSAEGGVNLIHKIEEPGGLEAWQPAEFGGAQNAFTGGASHFSALEGAVRDNLDRMRNLLVRKGGRGDA